MKSFKNKHSFVHIWIGLIYQGHLGFSSQAWKFKVHTGALIFTEVFEYTEGWHCFHEVLKLSDFRVINVHSLGGFKSIQFAYQ